MANGADFFLRNTQSRFKEVARLAISYAATLSSSVIIRSRQQMVLCVWKTDGMILKSETQVSLSCYKPRLV